MRKRTKTPRSACRILVADDSRLQQQIAAALLESRDCEITVVDNGVQAVAAAAARTFDVILMDVEMPEMDGLAATRSIREHEKAAGTHVPIIATTSITDQNSCLEAGMDAFVSKPLVPETLFATIDAMLRS
jgi:CheY-like chemotaxis protein